MADMEDFSRFFEDLSKTEMIIDKASDEVGEYLVRTIKARVRLGFGVANDGDRKDKFKELAESTIKHRQWLSRVGLLYPGSKPGRSHLTATGQMMDSLIYKKEPGYVILSFSNQEAENKAYYNDRGGRVTRPFFRMTDLEIKATERTLQKALDEYIDGIAQTL